MEVELVEANKPLTILCPMCGIQFIPTIGNVCSLCTIAKTDITIGITKEAVVNICRFCHRYLRPPWIHCDRGSKELLSLLLKKIRGLNKSRIINAGFIWTEEHSKRTKLKITIEKDLNNQTKIEQTFITEFVEAHIQCDDCKKEFTPHTWGAVVQVRQHVMHKKSFYFIEQAMLKHNAYDKVLKVSQEQDGLNFYFKNSTHAQRLNDFLGSLLPLRIKEAKQLISHDQRSNIFSYKYTYSVELPRICRNDLAIIPKKLARQLGGTSCLMLCTKVAQAIGLLDLSSFIYISMTSTQYAYYEKEIILLSLARYRCEFMIMDCNPVEKKKNREIKSISNKYAKKLFRYNVCRKDEYENIEVMGTLGDLHCGVYVEGYDLRSLSSYDDLDDFKSIQDIVLVRRTSDRKGMNKRPFKLKKLEDQGVIIEEKIVKKNKRGKRGDASDEDFEDFVDDVQNDPAMRKNVKLYKNPKVLGKDLKHLSQEQLDEILGEIQLCQLVDDMQIGEEPNIYENQVEGIDELVQGITNLTIKEGEEYERAQRLKEQEEKLE